MSDGLFELREVRKPASNVHFDFSFQHAADQTRSMTDKRNRMSQDVQALIDRFHSETDGHPPILQQLLNLYRKDGSYDIKAIILLGKVLQRLGEKYLTQLEELNKKLDVIDFIAANPDFVAMVYGDFSSHTDAFLDGLLQKD